MRSDRGQTKSGWSLIAAVGWLAMTVFFAASLAFDGDPPRGLALTSGAVMFLALPIGLGGEYVRSRRGR